VHESVEYWDANYDNCSDDFLVHGYGVIYYVEAISSASYRFEEGVVNIGTC